MSRGRLRKSCMDDIKDIARKHVAETTKLRKIEGGRRD